MGQENQGKTYYEVGDRVRTVYGNDICFIIAIHRTNNRYYIRYTENLNVQGTNVDSWIGYNGIKLDKEYYRDLKIKQILDEI
jgi:hypothetical protein